MAATSSTIPAVLDDLVARTKLAGTGAQVHDGPPTVILDGDVIFIGFNGIPGEAAVTDARTLRQYRPSPESEAFDVHCLVSAWPGGQNDMKAARDRAFELFDAMTAMLAAAPTLDGLVKRARISAGSLVQEQTTKGAVATLAVTVQVDADTR